MKSFFTQKKVENNEAAEVAVNNKSPMSKIEDSLHQKFEDCSYDSKDLGQYNPVLKNLFNVAPNLNHVLYK